MACESLMVLYFHEKVYDGALLRLTMAVNRLREGDLTLSNRKAAFCMIVATSSEGKLKRGIFCELAKDFKVAPSTIGRLWKSTLDSIDFFLSNHDMYQEAIDGYSLKFNWRDLPDEVYASGSTKNGRKKTLDRELLKERTRLVPLNKRKTAYSNMSYA
jgi:hypothetical protein